MPAVPAYTGAASNVKVGGVVVAGVAAAVAFLA
jgi:hypothetical protein